MTRTKIGAALVLATMLGAGVAQAATYDKPVEKEQSTQRSTSAAPLASTGGDTVAPWKVPTESLPSSLPDYPHTRTVPTYSSRLSTTPTQVAPVAPVFDYGREAMKARDMERRLLTVERCQKYDICY